MTRHLHFILNPNAGRGKALATWPRILEHLHPLTTSKSVTFSTHQKETDLAACPEGTILVAVGGDGTVHHVGQMAMKYNLPMAVIPAGTGNDFVHNVGIPDSLEQALITAVHGEEQLRDVFQVGDEWVLNACGFGLDADVVHYIESSPTLKRMGRLAYGFVLPLTLRRFRSFAMAVTIDGERFHYDHVSLVVISNEPTFGGGMRIAPGADGADGWLDICVVSNLGKARLLRLFPSVYKGAHTSHKSVSFHRGKEIHLEFPEAPRPGEFDGELAGPYERVIAGIHRNGLRVMVPKDTNSGRLV